MTMSTFEPTNPGASTDTAPQDNAASTTNKKKRQRKSNQEPHIRTQLTLRKPTWSYIHLQHLTSTTLKKETSDNFDELTAHLHLTAAFGQFLGLHGTAIPFDILKLNGNDLWIRIPAAERRTVVAAIGGWVGSGGEGWRVKGWSAWDVRACGLKGEGGSGQDLFG